MRPTTPNHVVSSVLSLPGVEATGLKEKEGGLELVAVKDIYRYPLKHYLRDRKIDLRVASRYLREVEYLDEARRPFYALGWACGDTYGLRSKTFKGFLGRGLDLNVFDQGTEEVYLFEGIFDFLSYLNHTKQLELPYTAIVMNSVALQRRLENWLRAHPEVKGLHCYLDNDTAGRACLQKLQDHFPGHFIQDHGPSYENYKDFADWYVAQP